MAGKGRTVGRMGYLVSLVVCCALLVCPERVGGFAAAKRHKRSDAQCEVLEKFLENRNVSREVMLQVWKANERTEDEEVRKNSEFCVLLCL